MFRVNASDVAAICGLHPYAEPRDTLLKFLRANDPSLLASLCQSDALGAQTSHERAKSAMRRCTISAEEAIVDDAALQRLKTECDAESRASVESYVFCARGARDERAELDRHAERIQAPVFARNDRLYTTTIDAGPHMVQLRGKIDGLRVGDDSTLRLVEHKRRQRRFFAVVPIYESVQCHVYMRMLGVSVCELVETLKDEHRTTDIHFDDATWNDIVQRLHAFLDRFISARTERFDTVNALVTRVFGAVE